MTPQFALPYDSFLGLDSSVTHDISVHPKRRVILSDKCFHPAMDVNFPFLSSTRPLKKDVPFLWNDAQQHSFTTLKDALTHAPILAFPDYKLPFTMCTDSSALGIGAVLMQREEGKRPHAIAYASCVLTSAESKYGVTHLDALAVVWALQYFRDIIFGYPITVYTDHTAVTQLFHGKNLAGRRARWYLTIQQSEPTLKYLLCKANTVADALSRNIPVAAVAQIPNFSSFELRTAQRQDTLWSKVIYALESGDDSTLPHKTVPLSAFTLIFLLHLTLTLLTVIGCGQLNVIDQFLSSLFSLARSEAKLAPPCCIFSYVLLFGCPHWVRILFLGLMPSFFFTY